GGSLVGQTARGGENPRAVPPLNRAGKERGSRCVAITSDSRASCCRADGVFYDRVAAALQGLGGRVLETPRSFLAIECESNGSSETRWKVMKKCLIWEMAKTKGISSIPIFAAAALESITSNAQEYVDIVTILHSKLISMLEHFIDLVLIPFQWNTILRTLQARNL
ncbi:hypothetical protein ALC56_04528, partial [Trachymyrmex septentrionalis]